MYVVCAQLTVREGEEETMLRAMRALVPASRGEPGCLQYIAHRDVADSRKFMFYEQYVDEAAFTAHTETDHYRVWVKETIAQILADRARAAYSEVV